MTQFWGNDDMGAEDPNETITLDPHPELLDSHQNPPISPGLHRLPQAIGNKPAVTQWFISVLNNPKKYPMYSMVTRMFPELNMIMMIRVEWHTWTHRAGKLVYGIYRGTTGYYMPLDGGESVA